MPKKEGFKPNLDSIWNEAKGKPGGRVEVDLRELIETGIDKSLALNKIKGVQWTEIDPAELRDGFDKAEGKLDRLSRSENVTHLKSYLAQTRQLLDKAKIPSSTLTSQQKKALLGHARTLNLIGVFQSLQIRKGYEGRYKADRYGTVDSWERWLRNNSYDAAALREVSNRIDTLEKRIQKTSAIAGGATGGKTTADTGRKNREKAGKLWERLRKSGKSKHVANEEVAVEMKKDTRTIQRWRKDSWK